MVNRPEFTGDPFILEDRVMSKRIGYSVEILFMVRMGEAVERATRKRFTNLLFGIRED